MTDGPENTTLDKLVDVLTTDIAYVEIVGAAGKPIVAAVTHTDGSTAKIEFADPPIEEPAAENGA